MMEKMYRWNSIGKLLKYFRFSKKTKRIMVLFIVISDFYSDLQDRSICQTDNDEQRWKVFGKV